MNRAFARGEQSALSVGPENEHVTNMSQTEYRRARWHGTGLRHPPPPPRLPASPLRPRSGRARPGAQGAAASPRRALLGPAGGRVLLPSAPLAGRTWRPEITVVTRPSTLQTVGLLGLAPRVHPGHRAPHGTCQLGLAPQARHGTCRLGQAPRAPRTPRTPRHLPAGPGPPGAPRHRAPRVQSPLHARTT